MPKINQGIRCNGLVDFSSLHILVQRYQRMQETHWPVLSLLLYINVYTNTLTC